MGAVHNLLLYLSRLLSSLRKPLGQPLRRLLQLCHWLLLRFSSRSDPPTEQKKIEKISDSGDRTDDVICASNVPTHLASTIAHDTPTLSSPIPIRANSHLSPYDFSSRFVSNSSLNLSDDRDHDGGIYHNLGPSDSTAGHPRPSSRASSQISCRNSHRGAEESALRSLRPPSLVIQSRSASPVSRRSPMGYGFHTGAEEISLQHLDHHNHLISHVSTRSRFPTKNLFTTELETRSMVDLQSRHYAAPTSRSPSRARSPSVNPIFRARSPASGPMALGGNLSERSCTPKADPSPGHVAANPSSSPEPIKDDLPDIRPCTTVARYDRNVKISAVDVKQVIPSLTTSYSRENLPRGWHPLAHPEGALYWVHEHRPIYTDAHLCDAHILDEINRFLQVIDQLIDESEGMPSDWELVLELADDAETGGRIWSYYFVDHTERTLFWLHDFDVDLLLRGPAGVVSRAHIHLGIQEYYWTHWDIFPHNREVPPELLKELIGILAHAGIDSLTSPVSTSMYSEEQLIKLLRFVKTLHHVDGNFGYAACMTGRLMSTYAYGRFVNFYGQQCARLSRDQSVYDDEATKPRSILLLLSALLFFAPEVHLRGLESIYIDWTVCQHLWTEFIAKLQKEWSDFTLSSTVLLAVNVSFLAIPSVDNGPDVRSPSQIASYLSVLASMGCIITGLLLTRQHRNKKDSATDINGFLSSKFTSKYGFEMLAIMYSLPYSLLMWSMITFLVAVVLEAIVRPTTLSARLPVAICWVMVGALVLWCAAMGWEWQNPLRLMRLILSWVPWKRKEESVEEGRGTTIFQNPSWLRQVIIPRRMSTRSTLVDPPTIQMTVQPPEDGC